MMREVPPRSLLSGASLFVDFDGTLVEIVSHPDLVVVGTRLDRLLVRLNQLLDGRIAILTGRPIDQIATLLDTARLSIAGSHGLEISWADGRSWTADRPAMLERAVAAMNELQSQYPGVLVEEKPYGVALHFRQAPEAEAVCHELAVTLAEGMGLQLEPGKMVFEIRSPAADKGVALQTFMHAPPMSGTMPVFLGDDLTDESAFAMAARLGGAGVLVGPERSSEARYRLDDVDATLSWLEAACEVLQ